MRLGGTIKYKNYMRQVAAHLGVQSPTAWHGQENGWIGRILDAQQQRGIELIPRHITKKTVLQRWFRQSSGFQGRDPTTQFNFEATPAPAPSPTATAPVPTQTVVVAAPTPVVETIETPVILTQPDIAPIVETETLALPTPAPAPVQAVPKPSKAPGLGTRALREIVKQRRHGKALERSHELQKLKVREAYRRPQQFAKPGGPLSTGIGTAVKWVAGGIFVAIIGSALLRERSATLTVDTEPPEWRE